MLGKFRETDIRTRATKEKLPCIILETELENEVKISSADIKGPDFICKITGKSKNVDKAALFLDNKFTVSVG